MALLLSPRARFSLAQAVQSEEGAPLGEVFRFASGLYFRGKLAYAGVFARPPARVPGTLVITPGAGLVPAEVPVRAADLRAFAAVPIDAAEARYRGPLERDARALAEVMGRAGEVVLLGSIATAKYVEPLLAILRERLVFPPEFVGRGDMSRGGLLLRAARTGDELVYAPVAGAVRHGPRPPRLPPLRPRAHPAAQPATPAPTPGDAPPSPPVSRPLERGRGDETVSARPEERIARERRSLSSLRGRAHRTPRVAALGDPLRLTRPPRLP